MEDGPEIERARGHVARRGYIRRTSGSEQMTGQSGPPAFQLSPRREIFCVEYANGATGTQAAITAGYSEKTAKVKASQLRRIPEVETRIAEIRGQARKDSRLTVQRHVQDLEGLATEAKGANQYGAAVTATKAQGQVCGLYEPGGVDEASRVPTGDIVHMMACGHEWAEAALTKLFNGSFEGFERTLRGHFSDVLGVKLIEGHAETTKAQS